VEREVPLRVPLYEYQCPKCGRFELIKKFSDEPLAKCPTCGSEVQKLLSAPAIQFKGTGWYVTDYARKSEGKGGKAGKSDGGESKSAGSDSGSKDTGSKDTGSKDTGSKDAGSKDTGKDSSSASTTKNSAGGSK
jgi:putative FmdB family regulatory protein